MLTPNQGLLDRCVTTLKTQVITVLAQGGPSLDIGCGDGRFTRVLPDVTGIDLNKEFEGAINTPDYFMDARDLDFPDESFSTVTLLDTLEHIPESDLVIKEAWRVLKHNGALIIIDPNDTVLLWARVCVFRFRDAVRGNPGHIHKFNKSRLIELTTSLFKLERRIRRGIFTGYRFRKIEDNEEESKA